MGWLYAIFAVAFAAMFLYLGYKFNQINKMLKNPDVQYEESENDSFVRI
tara:strand:- start:91 stop:237 length:147 start_codon:yes stop_codon:yes gene_type:complete